MHLTAGQIEFAVVAEKRFTRLRVDSTRASEELALEPVEQQLFDFFPTPAKPAKYRKIQVRLQHQVGRRIFGFLQDGDPFGPPSPAILDTELIVVRVLSWREDVLRPRHNDLELMRKKAIENIALDSPEDVAGIFAVNISRIAKAAAESDCELAALSLILSGAEASPGNLGVSQIESMKTVAKQALQDSGVVMWAALGVDISLNDGTKKGCDVHWQAQLYGIALISDREDLDAQLRVAFPKSKMIGRPIRIARYDGSRYGASYSFKTKFVRRVSYWDASGKYACWRARKCSLKAREEIELLLALDRLGMRKRVLFLGIRPKVDANGVRLVIVGNPATT